MTVIFVYMSRNVFHERCILMNVHTLKLSNRILQDISVVIETPVSQIVAVVSEVFSPMNLIFIFYTLKRILHKFSIHFLYIHNNQFPYVS